MARPVSVNIPHNLGKTEARRRIDSGFAEFGASPSAAAAAVARLERRWQDDKMTFRGRVLGQSLSGHIDVAEDNVEIAIVLPTMLAALTEKILGRVKTEGQRLLNKS